MRTASSFSGKAAPSRPVVVASVDGDHVKSPGFEPSRQAENIDATIGTSALTRTEYQPGATPLTGRSPDDRAGTRMTPPGRGVAPSRPRSWALTTACWLPGTATLRAPVVPDT